MDPHATPGTPATTATTAPAPLGHAAHAPHADAHPHPKYFKIFFILLVVTIVEVFYAVVTTGAVKNIGLVFMSLYKAVLVAAYFMHLKFEKRTMWIIASAPLIFGVIFAIGAYPDSEKGLGFARRGDLERPADPPADHADQADHAEKHE